MYILYIHDSRHWMSRLYIEHVRRNHHRFFFQHPRRNHVIKMLPRLHPRRSLLLSLSSWLKKKNRKEVEEIKTGSSRGKLKLVRHFSYCCWSAGLKCKKYSTNETILIIFSKIHNFSSLKKLIHITPYFTVVNTSICISATSLLLTNKKRRVFLSVM